MADTLDSLNQQIRSYSTRMELTKEQWVELRELHRKRVKIKKLMRLVMPPEDEEHDSSLT